MELRYLNRLVRSHHRALRLVTSLQYRVLLNPLEIGMQDPIWSDWEDVPMVNENETEEG